MSTKDLALVGIIFLAMFTLFKIETDKNCKHDMPIMKTVERPMAFKIYE